MREYRSGAGGVSGTRAPVAGMENRGLYPDFDMKRLLFLMLCFAQQSMAQPLAVGASGAVTVTLTDERCAMAAVANLPGRATWSEGGKIFEGCWGLMPETGIVLAYFDDKSVVAIPAAAFRRVTSL